MATADPDLSESLYEVIDGVIVEKPPIDAYEMSLANLLGFALANFADPLGTGRIYFEMLFDLRPAVDRERRPDVAFVSAERWPVARRLPRVSAWRIVPDLAIEVVGASSLASDMAARVNEYFLVGMIQVWVVYPRTRWVHVYDSTTSVRVFGRGDVLTDDTLLPGFRLDLDEFFGPPEMSRPRLGRAVSF